MHEASYTVSGMSCGHCASKLTEKVGAIAGVTGVEVDVASGRLAIVSEGPLAGADLDAVVTAAGFQLAG
ncbi:heavy-metal-associated domain-containing protein [Actinokineospora iranica]|uniref:Copper chaperone CopZ n=1 Tax=Actinokineospora iranica TaxID=1271860 RepID=A0A1G6LFK5_9PSEU|nr:heavy-metal-associated domain-containing protein [Actinokineospora iranica]SDC41366.1 Copper chaperone CopZ [Actinokineospora iranica]